MISTNLNVSTCSVENEIKAPSTPNDLRIDIRTVSEFHFLLNFPLFIAKKLSSVFGFLFEQPISARMS